VGLLFAYVVMKWIHCSITLASHSEQADDADQLSFGHDQVDVP
jgi:hypothetical protein